MLVIQSLVANDGYELKLFEKILPSLFQKNTLIVYSDKKITKLISKSDLLYVTKNCLEADIIVGRYFKNLDGNCNKKPLFTTYYKEFKNNPEVIGAFYWRKGRPQLKFHKKALDEQKLFLNSTLIKYAE